jgi:hypothetical protein
MTSADAFFLVSAILTSSVFLLYVIRVVNDALERARDAKLDGVLAKSYL